MGPSSDAYLKRVSRKFIHPEDQAVHTHRSALAQKLPSNTYDDKRVLRIVEAVSMPNGFCFQWALMNILDFRSI